MITQLVENLKKSLSSSKIVEGLNATADSFYSSQGIFLVLFYYNFKIK
jgi:hypothetical protein